MSKIFEVTYINVIIEKRKAEVEVPDEYLFKRADIEDAIDDAFVAYDENVWNDVYLGGHVDGPIIVEFKEIKGDG